MTLGFACPCCHALTRSTLEHGTYEICPVCGWEDDDLQSSMPDFGGGANNESLNEARANYKAIGAINTKSLRLVRPPSKDEIPKDLSS